MRDWGLWREAGGSTRPPCGCAQAIGRRGRSQVLRVPHPCVSVAQVSARNWSSHPLGPPPPSPPRCKEPTFIFDPATKLCYEPCKDPFTIPFNPPPKCCAPW